MPEPQKPDDEIPDPLVPPAGDKSSLEINNPNDTEIPSPNQPMDTMEVHHHSHPHNSRNFSTYIWEFLMLFLAVFCGFLAEYKLEHVIEHQREKKLMKTLSNDLVNDTETLGIYIGWRKQTEAAFDSMMLLLSSPEPEKYANLLYPIMHRSALRFGLPDISSGTISQLTNGGGLRLVRSATVSDAINKHYLGLNRMKANYETERMARLQLAETKAQILDATLLWQLDKQQGNFTFFSKDPALINRLMNDILTAQQLNKSLIKQLESFALSTTQLNELIQREYHFH
jgi:hypothetical protein